MQRRTSCCPVDRWRPATRAEGGTCLPRQTRWSKSLRSRSPIGRSWLSRSPRTLLQLTCFFSSHHGPPKAEGKGRRSKSLCHSLRGCQKATMFISRLPEAMHSQRCALVLGLPFHTHLFFKAYSPGSLVTERKPTRARPLLPHSTMRKILPTSRMNPY